MKKSHSVRSLILAGSLLLQLNTLCLHSRGAAGDVDLSFDPGSGVNGPVNTVAVQPDGKVLIAGFFTTVKGLARSGIARLNADGSGDATFNAGTNAAGYLRSVALQSDGKVLIAGHSYPADGNDFFQALAVRFNSNGTLDNSFIPQTPYPYGSGFESVLIQPDGKVLLGGYFIEYYVDEWGDSYYYQRSLLIRLNTNGTPDTSFTDGNGKYDGSISSVALQPDGKVLIGGDIATTVNGTNRYGIARHNADGSRDSSFDPGTGANGSVASVALQSDGKVFIGGRFTAVNGTNRIGIARLNSNGSLDGSFNPGTGVTGNGYLRAVKSVAVQSGGKVLIGGEFSTVNGTNRNRIARLDADGSLDGSFNPGTGANGDVNSVVVQSNGKVLIGGSFTTVNGTNRNRMARLNADGSLDGSFHPGTGVDIFSSLTVQPDGKVLIGGSFTYFNGTNPNGRARLNADGSLDGTFSPTSFNPDIGVISSENDYNVVTAAAGQSDGKVLIGGYSVHWDCDPESCNVWAIYFLNRVNADGSRDPSFFYPSSVDYLTSGWDDYAIKSIVVQSDGKVLIGGNSPVNGTNVNWIARLNSNGSGTGATTPSYYSMVSSVVVQSDGKVLIGGYFTAVNGTNRNGIARLSADESLDSSFNPNLAPGSSVYSIAGQPDGKVLIGGGFATVNGTNRNRIARLNADGSLDNTFNPGTGADGFVSSIALQSDGNVLIGGDFTTVNGVLRAHVARLYGDSVAPTLNIARSNAFVIVSWPVTGLNFQLQENTDLSLPNSWSPVAQAAVTNAGQISVTVPTTDGRKFFRLKSP